MFIIDMVLGKPIQTTQNLVTNNLNYFSLLQNIKKKIEIFMINGYRNLNEPPQTNTCLSLETGI